MTGARLVMPAIMPHSADELRAQVLRLTEFAPYVHLDIMDGALVRRTSWPYTEDGIPSVVLPSREFYARISVHLMVQDAYEIGVAFARSGAAAVIAQYESFERDSDAREALLAWREAGTPVAGLSIQMDTPLADIMNVAESCDVLHVMSIDRIGFQGDPFDPAALGRLRELRQLYPGITLSVDGGVSVANIGQLARAGATRFAVGSNIVKSKDPLSAYRALVSVLDAVE